MKFVKSLSKPIFLIPLVALVAFIAGYLPSKSRNVNGSNHETSLDGKSKSGNELLNPLLPKADKIGLDFSELRSFKPEIEAYISNIRRTNPDIHVSYYFRDLNNGLWTGINERETFIPASLFKIPLLIAVLKRAQTEPEILKLGMKYDREKLKDIEEESGFPKVDGKFYTVDELLEQMVCYSDNTASLALLNFVKDSAVLEVIHDMNIQVNNNFDEHTNFVSVKAYAGAMRVLYNRSYLNEEMSEKALDLLSRSKYTGGIRRAIPADITVAHKYGKRDDVVGENKLKTVQLHHFAVIYHRRKPFILGIMTKGGTLEAKERLIYDLAKITWNEVESQTIGHRMNSIYAE